MADRTQQVIEEQIELWSGVKPPSETARAMATQLAAVIKGFEALRESVAFEDEPSSFEAALEATKDQE